MFYNVGQRSFTFHFETSQLEGPSRSVAYIIKNITIVNAPTIVCRMMIVSDATTVVNFAPRVINYAPSKHL